MGVQGNAALLFIQSRSSFVSSLKCGTHTYLKNGLLLPEALDLNHCYFFSLPKLR